MTHSQTSHKSSAALLKSCSITAQKNNILCGRAAGITALCRDSTEGLKPHEKLLEAAPPDGTLIAQDSSPAQPAQMYDCFRLEAK